MMSKSCEKFRLKSLGHRYKYNKITTSSITINARLQQVTLKCILKNLKMLAGYHSFFSLISQSYEVMNHTFFLEILS